MVNLLGFHADFSGEAVWFVLHLKMRQLLEIGVFARSFVENPSSGKLLASGPKKVLASKGSGRYFSRPFAERGIPERDADFARGALTTGGSGRR